MTRIVVLGAGSFGTALSIHLARGRPDRSVILWGWAADDPEGLERARENVRYLPGMRFPDDLRVGASLESCAAADVAVAAVPSGAMREVATGAAPHLRLGTIWVSATKGLEPGTRMRMSEVLREVLPASVAVAALSGPSFAREVASGEPTAVVVACEDLAVARRVRDLVSDATFRAYAATDVVGVELGGALKNIIAIGAGMVAGLGLGHDAVAALITRGLREITVLGVAMGAERHTFSGLAGLGDLVLTCTGGASRNRRLGEMLAQGRTLDEARAVLGQVSEGVETCERALEEGRRLGIELPITSAVADILFHGMSARDAVDELMQRTLKDEDP